MKWDVMGLRSWIGRLAAAWEAIPYTGAGNRSVIRLNYRALLQDRQLLRMATEYRATGSFPGHLTELTPEDAAFVDEIRSSLLLLRERQRQVGFKAGRMWDHHNGRMIENALQADRRLFSHVGALDYKSFIPCPRSLEFCLFQVLRALLCYEHLRPPVTDFGGLFTELNSAIFTIDGHAMNEGIRAYEELLALRPVLERLEVHGRKPLRVIEIGAGNGQLTNLLLREGATGVVIDLPGMHAQAPFLLHRHSGKRICTYHRFAELGYDVERALLEHDLLYLPPWEIGRLRSRFDLAVNVHSLGEMSPSEVAEYLRFIDTQCDTFFSVNTTLQGLDARRQPEYRENSALDFPQHLRMKVCKSGTLFYNTSLQQAPHYSYGIFSHRFAPSDFLERKAPETAAGVL